MISDPTVFILGAGANCSYGFPSGPQLKDQCVARIRASVNQPGNSFQRLADIGTVEARYFQPDQCLAFAESLEKSGHASIDAFLNAYRERTGFNEIGKGAIAQVLLGYEKDAFERPTKDDWLLYLIQIMLEGVGSVEEFVESNKISFVTFNYDRFLEAWLLERIRHSFNIVYDEALEVLNKIPIHPVYGTLGPFRGGNEDDTHEWVEASSNIRTIFDVEEDNKLISEIRGTISGARHICLLGFGFHEENIEILNLAKYIRHCQGNITASRFGFTEQEWKRATHRLGTNRIQSSDTHLQCRDSIRNLPVFGL